MEEVSSMIYLFITLLCIFITNNNTYISRFWFPGELVSNSLSHGRKSVREALERNDDRREDLCLIYNSRKMREKFKDDFGLMMVEKIVTWKGIPPRSNANRDRIHMQNFLEKTSSSQLVNIEQVDFREYLPNGSATLHQLLMIKTLCSDWNVPNSIYLQTLLNNSGIDYNDLGKVSVQEITLGTTSRHDSRTLDIFVEQSIRSNQLNYPSGLLSLDTQYIRIPEGTYEKMIKAAKNWHTSPEPVTCKVPDFYDKNCKRIPSRIVIGDGIDWMLSIRFNWEIFVDEKGIRHYKFNLSEIKEKDPILVRLFSAAAYVGYNIINQRNDIQSLLNEIYGLDIILPECLEMEALAVANGWMLPQTDRLTINFLTMGNLLNQDVGCADGTWCVPWDQLATEFKIYAIGNVRAGFTNSTVLLISLARNLFPDLNVLCSTLELPENGAIEWFCSLVTHVFKECTRDRGLKDISLSRKDDIKSLCAWIFRADYFQEQRSSCTRKVEIFSDLVPDWSTIAYGGARFLHSATAFFVKQYGLLQQLDYQHPTLIANLSKDINEDFIKSCTFGRGNDTGRTYQPTKKIGLQPNPEYVDHIAKIDLSHLKTKDLAHANLPGNNQTKVESILECCRCNPDFVSSLFSALQDVDLNDPDYSFWIRKTSLYEKLRNMKFFTTGVLPQVITQIEAEIQRHQKNVISLEETTRKKDEISVERRKKREELLRINAGRSNIGVRQRSGLQQKVYDQIPGHQSAKNKRKKNHRKKVMATIRQLPDYIPEDTWRSMKKIGKQPVRATVHNVKATGKDLRDVVKHKEEKKKIRQTQGTISSQAVRSRDEENNLRNEESHYSKKCSRSYSSKSHEHSHSRNYRSSEKEMEHSYHSGSMDESYWYDPYYSSTKSKYYKGYRSPEKEMEPPSYQESYRYENQTDERGFRSPEKEMEQLKPRYYDDIRVQQLYNHDSSLNDSPRRTVTLVSSPDHHDAEPSINYGYDDEAYLSHQGGQKNYEQEQSYYYD